jgi:hypothetical protein
VNPSPLLKREERAREVFSTNLRTPQRMRVEPTGAVKPGGKFISMIFSEPIWLGDYVVGCPVAFNGAKYGLTRQKIGGTSIRETCENEE